MYLTLLQKNIVPRKSWLTQTDRALPHYARLFLGFLNDSFIENVDIFRRGSFHSQLLPLSHSKSTVYETQLALARTHNCKVSKNNY